MAPQAPGHYLGDVIGGCRLEALLGTGGFGSVWRATQLESGNVVAVKLLTGTYSTGDVAQQRADIELLAAAAGQASRHVVGVLSGGIEPTPHLVMEFIDGTNLASELRARGSLGLRESIELGLAVTDALAALETSGIVHRDVKPANVMIDRQGVVKLTDFGIAKIVGYDSASATGTMPLSMAYAAPEVWDGAPVPQSDLYALGILVYECTVGHPPFLGTPTELLRQHSSTRPDLRLLPPGTPPSLIEFLARCMAKDLTERIPDASTCTTLLQQALRELEEDGAETSSDGPRRIGPWIRRAQLADVAWDCVHNETGEAAVVELIASDDVGLAERLKAAVDANRLLVPFGAERLLGTNRLMLRPDESWSQLPAGAFQFWVAREATVLPAPPSTVSRDLLVHAASNLQAMIEVAADCGLAVAFESLALLPDGRVFVGRPGLPPTSAADPASVALEWLRTLPAGPEDRALLAGVASLEALPFRRLAAVEVASPAREPQSAVVAPAARSGRAATRRGLGRWLLAGGLLAALFVGVGAVYIVSTGATFGFGQEPAQPAIVAEPAPVLPDPEPLGLVAAGIVPDAERDAVEFARGTVGYRFRVVGADLDGVVFSPTAQCALPCQRGALTWGTGPHERGYTRRTPDEFDLFIDSGAPAGSYAFTLSLPDGRSVTGEVTPQPRTALSVGSRPATTPILVATAAVAPPAIPTNAGTTPVPTATAPPVSVLDPTATAAPVVPAAVPTAASQGGAGTALTDDFSNRRVGLIGDYENPASSALYAGGEFVITLKTPGTGTGAFSPAPYGNNVTIEADVRPISGAPAESLLCRVQWPQLGQYNVQLDAPRRLFKLGLTKPDGTFATLVDWTLAPGVDPTGWNRLRMSCIGDTITASVGGSSISARDGTLQAGKIGFNVSFPANWPSPMTGSGAFDNLVVTLN